jgi:hypothetical protein
MSPKPVFENETVKYTGDSIIGTDTVKKLRHKRILVSFNYTITPITLIMQRGDTVFMRNPLTQHKWRILYNFAAQPGHSWTTVLSNAGYTSTNSFTVTSVSFTLINGYTLKKLSVLNKYNQPLTITERLGAEIFVFPFYGGDSDGDMGADKLCYSDNQLGLLQYTSSACDYSFAVGVSEESAEIINVYPNPADNLLHLKLNSERGTVSLLDLSGRTILESVIITKETTLSTAYVPDGLYIVRIVTEHGERFQKIAIRH